MTITAPDAPTLPSLNDPANFNTRALALFSWLVTEYIPWLETLAGVTEDGEINGTPIGQKAAAAGKFTTLLADSLGGAAVQSSATDTTQDKKLVSVEGAYAAARSRFGEYKASSAGYDIDNAPAGFSGLVHDANPGTWPIPPYNTFVWLETQALYGGNAVVQRALYGYSSGSTPSDRPRTFQRLRNDSGSAWGGWSEILTADGDKWVLGRGGVSSGARLEVYGGNPTAGDILIDPGGASGLDYMGFYAYGAENNKTKMHWGRKFTGDGTFQSYMTMDGFTGKVGIQTSAPTVELEVRGKITAGGTPVGSTAMVAARNSDDSAGCFQSTDDHASYAGASISSNVQRAASSAYRFYQAYSGNWGDLEFRLAGDGNGTCDGSWTGGGADYAEYFEWADGNPNGETRTGLSVVLDGDKIRPAQLGETPIGVISANPSVVGDGDIDRWKGKYLRDDFGAYIWEDYEAVSWTEAVTETETVQEQATKPQERTREVVEVVGNKAVKKTVTETVQVPLFDELPLEDEQGNVLGTHRVPRMVEVEKETTKEVSHSYAADEVPAGVTVPADAERVIQQRRKLNPEYDPAAEYTPRAERPEWDMVGLMGKLRLRKGQPVAPNWIKMRDVSAEVEEWLVK